MFGTLHRRIRVLVEQLEHRRAGECDLFRGSACAVGHRVEVSPLFRRLREPLRPHARVAHTAPGPALPGPVCLRPPAECRAADRRRQDRKRTVVWNFGAPGGPPLRTAPDRTGGRVITMAKARNFSELRNRLPAESLARVEARVKVTLHDMALDELRTARELTQERLAETLGIRQATVSKIERQSDMYVSTLAKFIEAMGGTLEIRACFPEGSVRIKQFSEARSPSAG